MSTPWKIDAKTAEAMAEVVAERIQNIEEAIKLSQVMGQCCNDKNLVIVEMALAVMLAHIIDGYPDHEKKQAVYDRFWDFVMVMSR